MNDLEIIGWQLLVVSWRKSVTVNFLSFIDFDNGFRRGDRNVRQKYLKFLLIWKNKYIIKYNYLFSSSKQLQLSNLFLLLWNELKSAFNPAGNRSSPPRAWYTTALTITPPCQLLNGHPDFILPNRFLLLWNQRKTARGPAGNRSSPFRLRALQHHHYTSVTFLFSLILFFHSWAIN